MRNRFDYSEIQLKKRSFFILLIAGGCASAFAQAPALSLPSLPALPQVKGEALASIPSLADTAPALPSLPSANDKAGALPSLRDLPELPKVEDSADAPVDKKAEGSTMPITLKARQDNAVPAADAVADASLANQVPTVPDVQVDASVAGMPALPLPTEQSALATPAMPDAPIPTLSFPVDIAVEDAPKSTWLGKLSPSIVPKETDFNYKRNLLSEAVYRTEYDKNNRHLPRRITRDDYANLLFNSVAQNDVNATRALLNAGVSLKTTNPYGETPLMLAKRLRVTQVVALLEARGAQE